MAGKAISPPAPPHTPPRSPRHVAQPALVTDLLDTSARFIWPYIGPIVRSFSWQQSCCRTSVSQAQAAWTSFKEFGRQSSTRPTVNTKDNQLLSSLEPSLAIACLSRSADKQQHPLLMGIQHQRTSQHPFCSTDPLSFVRYQLEKGSFIHNQAESHCSTSAKRQLRGHH